MGFNDELEYEDDDDFFDYGDDDDDDYYDDDDDDSLGSRLGGMKSNSPFNRPSGSSGGSGFGVKGFGSSGSNDKSGSGSSPFGSGSGSRSSFNRSSSSSPSSPSGGGFRSSGGNKPSGGGGLPGGNRSSFGSSSSTPSRPSSGGFGSKKPDGGGSSSSSSGSGFRSPGGNKPSSGGSSFGSKPSSGGSSSFGSKPSGGSSSSGGGFRSPGGNKPSSGGSSSFGSKPSSGGSSAFGSNKPNSGANKKDDKSDDKASGGGRFGGLGNRFGGNKDNADKKDDKGGDKASGGGRFGGLGNRFGGNKDNADKKDDKSGGKSGGGIAAAAGAAGVAGALGGLRNRFGGGNKDDADKKDSGNKAGAKPSSGSSAFGNNKPSGSSGFGGSRTSSSGSSAFGSNKPSGGATTGSDKKSSPFGNRVGGGKGKDAKAPSGKTAAATAANASGGGITGRIGNLFGRGGDNKASGSKRPKQSKVPTTSDQEGLTLDNWLDILGVGLVFGSLVLFFSAISSEQAAISGIHTFFGELLGWGAFGFPFFMFAVGMWLIIRHFGDDAPTIDPIRVAGIGVLYVTALVLFQYIDSFGYEGVTSFELLRVRLEVSWRVYNAGGGAIGSELYYWLVTNVTEIGGFFVLVLATIIGSMLLTRLTASEMATFVISMWRSWRTGMAQRASSRRAERELALQQARMEQAQAQMVAQTASASGSDITIEKPAAAQLEGAAVAALPEGTAIPQDNRGIRFNMGGQLQTVPVNGQAVQNNLPLGQPQHQPIPQQPVATNQLPLPQNNQQSNGVLSRFFGRGSSDDNNANGATMIGGVMAGALMSGGGNNKPPKLDVPENPLPMDDPDPVPPYQQPRTPTPIFNAASQATPEPVQSTPHIQQPPQPTAIPTPSTESPVQQPAASVEAQPIFNADADRVQGDYSDYKPDGEGGTTRIDRLSQLRSGKTGPLSSPAETSASPAQAPAASTDASPFGEVSRSTPPSQLPSVQSGNNEIFQQPLSIPPDTTTSQPAASTTAQPFGKPVGMNFGNPDTPAPLTTGGSVAQNQPVSSPIQRQTPRPDWRMPDFRTLLSSGSEQEFDREHLLKQARTIEETLEGFGSPGRVVEVNTGPVITQFGVEPDYLTGRSGKKQRVKVSAIAALDKDLQLALNAKSIRVEAPVPGKGYVGIEVPNEEHSLVSLRDVMESADFRRHTKSPLTIALGQSVSGAPISADLAAMPHCLIAGTTGSGKSVCVNSIITSIIARNSPEDVKFIMVDPKRVELTGYNGIPHLVAPVVVELERIVGVLKWVTREMDERYRKFSDAGSRNIVDYNKHRDPGVEKMPYIVVIIDELADLMMLAPEETERTITRIAALARATGIHLVIATQRPSVDVVTGLIKANFPARIAFAVAGSVDSRVILDQPGAERLLGKGDMLYLSGDSPAALRLQGVFVSDMEINNIVRYWKMQAVDQPAPRPISMLNTNVAPNEPAKEVKPRGERVKQQAFWDEQAPLPVPNDFGSGSSLDSSAISGDTGGEDDLYEKAVELVRRLDRASVSLLQRRLRIGYTRAARLIDTMEARGVIGPAKDGSSKPRDVIKNHKSS